MGVNGQENPDRRILQNQTRHVYNSRVLRVSSELLEATRHHLRTQFPNEGVGLWLGKGGRVVQVVPLENTHPSPLWAYTADPNGLLKALKEAEKAGLDLLAIYHSHPNSSAQPSESDRAQAFWRVAYVILAMKTGETRAWKLPDLEEILIYVD